MQLFAASIAEAASTFLHAGYISANQRTLGFMPSGTPKLQLEMTEAVRLKGEAVAQSLGGGEAAAAVGGSGLWTQTLLAAALLSGGILAWLLIRERLSARGRKLVLLAGTGALLGILACHSLPSTPPWKGVELREYADPQQATLALLNGVVADGIINVGDSIDCLANIRNEVGFPKKELTEGEAYALQTYGIDGWGHEMRLREDGEKRYTVTSAGADGIFDTGDDLSISVKQAEEDTWDRHRWAFFLRNGGELPAVLFHRWTGEHFRYSNEERARELTGGKLFDVFNFNSSMPDDERDEQLRAAYDSASAGLTREPLVLLVY